MMLSRASRRKILPLAALLLPALAVQGFRLASGWQPAQSRAAEAPPAVEPAPEAGGPSVLKPEQVRAAEWISRHAGVRVARSPMDHPPALPVAEPEPMLYPLPPEPEAPAPPTSPPPPPSMKTNPVLTAIMSGPTPIASINGRLYRIGESIQPGWTITAIDARLMSVTLEGPQGKVFELTRSGFGER